MSRSVASAHLERLLAEQDHAVLLMLLRAIRTAEGPRDLAQIEAAIDNLLLRLERGGVV